MGQKYLRKAIFKLSYIISKNDFYHQVIETKMALFIALLSTFKKLRPGVMAFDIQDVRESFDE